MEELNKKLLEFAGFEYSQTTPEWALKQGKPSSMWWLDPEYCCCRRNKPPGFTNPMWGLAYAFKWLVPRTIDKIMAEQGCSSDVAYAILFKKWLQELELNMTQPALSLCLAISKLIGEKSED